MKKFAFTVCAIAILMSFSIDASAQIPKIDNVLDWNLFCNSYIDNATKSLSSVWLYNGNLVEKGWGFFVISSETGLLDSVPFLYMAGIMVFRDADYCKLPSHHEYIKTAGVNVVRENTGEMVPVHIYFFPDLTQCDPLAKHFQGKFPSEWLIKPVEENIMHNLIFRITELRNGFYLIDLSTHGAFLSYDASYGIRSYKRCNDRNLQRLRKAVLRKHKSVYGRNFYRNK